MSRFVGLLVILAILGSTSPVSAYPKHTNQCNDNSIIYYFSNHGDIAWSTTRKNRVRESLETVEDALSYKGVKLISFTEGSGGVKLTIRDEPGGVNGSSECFFGAEVWLNGAPGVLPDKGHWQFTSRHEMLHLAGMSHGGDDDAMDGRLASNATCITTAQRTGFSQGSYPDSVNLDQDTASYANWLHENDLPYRQVSANIGFETGTKYWWKNNGTWSEVSSGGATGPGYLSFTATGNEFTSYVYQTSRVWHGNSNARNFRAKINYRESDLSANTKVRARIYAKKLKDDSTPASCDYDLGLSDPNNGFTLGGWVLISDSGMQNVNTTSWTALTSPWGDPDDHGHLDFADGFQLQIRAFGKSTPGGGGPNPSINFHLDNIRTERK